jgi:UDP-N-acetylmuramate dehydrogenase
LERLHGVNLRDWNSFGISEIADECWRIEQVCEVPALLQDPALSSLAPLLIGAGSNLLITGPVHRPLVRFEFSAMTVIQETESEAIVQAEAGANWHLFVLWCLGQNLFGLENLSLIPGSVGASPVQNIGAYGVEMKDCFHSLDAYDIKAGTSESDKQPLTLFASDCEFGYRDSVFKRQTKLWITAVRFKLRKTPLLRLDYGDIKHWLAEQRIGQPRPRDVSNAVIAIRSSKLPDPKKIGNAGSFFKNPLIPANQADELLGRFPDMPQYPNQNLQERKLSAAWLIDQCGLKGFREGDAGVHEAHALVLVNYGRASGQAILQMAQKIQNSVYQRFGVRLEPEPIII